MEWWFDDNSNNTLILLNKYLDLLISDEVFGCSAQYDWLILIKSKLQYESLRHNYDGADRCTHRSRTYLSLPQTKAIRKLRIQRKKVMFHDRLLIILEFLILSIWSISEHIIHFDKVIRYLLLSLICKLSAITRVCLEYAYVY